MSKNYLAYTFLIFAALFWSGNFIIGKFATLFEVPPLSLNFLRWVMVWFIIFLIFTFILGQLETDLKQKSEYRIKNYEEFKKE